MDAGPLPARGAVGERELAYRPAVFATCLDEVQLLATDGRVVRPIDRVSWTEGEGEGLAEPVGKNALVCRRVSGERVAGRGGSVRGVHAQQLADRLSEVAYSLGLGAE